MPTTFTIQGAQGQDLATVTDLISRIAGRQSYDSFHAASAYVSVAGVRRVLASVGSHHALARSYWLFGLDDDLTHPSAIALAKSLPGAQLRVAGERAGGDRFHAKVYAFTSSTDGSKSAMVVGSANLTHKGLATNVEAVLAQEASNLEDASALRLQWERLWSIGREPSDALLEQYASDFIRVQRRRRKDVAEGIEEVLVRDDATVDPSVARVCWIEVGNITGFQQEQLEIKAEQALFFGLPLAGGPDALIRLGVSTGHPVDVPAKYRHNAMWRFNLPQSVPEVAAGLRPDGGRSPYVAVFERGAAPDRVSLRFVRLKTPAAARLRERSRQAGTLGRTSAREYGWY